jgi:hypothetical protein
VIVAVGQKEYVVLTYDDNKKWSRDEAMVFDIKGVMKFSERITYKRL